MIMNRITALVKKGYWSWKGIDLKKYGKNVNIMNENYVIKLSDIYKNKRYAKNRCNIIINEEIILKNADIVLHGGIDWIDIYVKEDDQRKDIIDNLKKYRCMRLPLSTEYLVPVDGLIFQRIIMVC